jgi:xanthine dehydrogenase accessory factor
MVPKIMTGRSAIVLGGGELGTGVAHALFRSELRVLVVDRPVPGALRLGVAFAAAAVGVERRITVEHVAAVLCPSQLAIEAAWARGEVPLWVGPVAALRLRADVCIDARMRRLTAPLARWPAAELRIGIGPGFVAGSDVDLVVESNRGPTLGRVLDHGSAERHTGVPGLVAGYREPRILRAPCAGRFVRRRALGAFVEPGDAVGEVAGQAVRARLHGMVRGLKLTGVLVGAGHKVGDVDPRRERALLTTMTDKARAVGQGVLGALELAGLLAPDHISSA